MEDHDKLSQNAVDWQLATGEFKPNNTNAQYLLLTIGNQLLNALLPTTMGDIEYSMKMRTSFVLSDERFNTISAEISNNGKFFCNKFVNEDGFCFHTSLTQLGQEWSQRLPEIKNDFKEYSKYLTSLPGSVMFKLVPFYLACAALAPDNMTQPLDVFTHVSPNFLHIFREVQNLSFTRDYNTENIVAWIDTHVTNILTSEKARNVPIAKICKQSPRPAVSQQSVIIPAASQSQANPPITSQVQSIITYENVVYQMLPPVIVNSTQQPPVIMNPNQQPPVIVNSTQQPPVIMNPNQQPPVIVNSTQQPPVILNPNQQPSVIVNPTQPTKSVNPAVVKQKLPNVQVQKGVGGKFRVLKCKKVPVKRPSTSSAPENSDITQQSQSQLYINIQNIVNTQVENPLNILNNLNTHVENPPNIQNNLSVQFENPPNLQNKNEVLAQVENQPTNQFVCPYENCKIAFSLKNLAMHLLMNHLYFNVKNQMELEVLRPKSTVTNFCFVKDCNFPLFINDEILLQHYALHHRYVFL